jgi:hypothetical protein
MHGAKVTPRDHDNDPGYKVNVWADLTGSYPNKLVAFDAIHTMISGKEYQRPEQYTNATLRLNNNVIQWTGWWRNRQMTGTLLFNNGHWHYDEQQVDRNRRVLTTINTICHDEPEGNE